MEQTVACFRFGLLIFQLHLSHYINQMVFESQLPHNIVSLLSTASLLHNKLKIW